VESVQSYARELVAGCVDLPGILDSIRDDDDLVACGIDSGEILNVALRCEQVLGRPLTDGELSRLTSISAVAELVQAAVP
jgi:acyl carrier protein